MKIKIIPALLLLTLMSCISVQITSAQTAAPVKPTTTTAPPGYTGHEGTARAIIYRTKADYSQYVPVTLSDDGSKIISFPAPKNVPFSGRESEPEKLANGYLLDNRGLTTHSAFLNITYADYSKLKTAPTAAELYQKILDKSPFTDMYDIGERNLYNDNGVTINAIITGGKLGQYKKIL